MSNIAVIEPANRPPLAVGGRPQAIVPQDMDSCYRLAKAVCLAGMAPKGMDTPEKCMIAIMRGMEVGMTPFMALDKIAIVNGRPTIWGDGAMGLVRGSGLCEFVKEWIEGDGDKRVAYCEAKRRGESDPIRRKFSVTDAKEAGLWGKPGPWQQFKERMLQMRARAFCLRDGFADVLGGLYLKEEMDDVPANVPRDVSPPMPPMPPAPAIAAPQAVPTPPAPPVPPAPAIPEPPAPPLAVAPVAQAPDAEKIIAELTEALDAAQEGSDVFEAYDDIVTPFLADLFPPDVAVLERMRDDKLRRLG